MNKELIEQLEKRKEDLEAAFNVTKKTQAELNDRLRALLEKQLEIRGAHQEIERLLKDK